MDDQNASSPVSRRIFLGGGVVALTAAAAAPVAFNYASRGHGDWWPDHVVHAGHADDPGRHYHYVRDQLVVAQDDLGELRGAHGLAGRARAGAGPAPRRPWGRAEPSR